MSARQPRFEVVRTDAGWHGRFRAGNGKVIWTTEVYERERNVRHAMLLLGDAPRYSDGKDADLIEVRVLDEREVTA